MDPDFFSRRYCPRLLFFNSSSCYLGSMMLGINGRFRRVSQDMNEVDLESKYGAEGRATLLTGSIDCEPNGQGRQAYLQSFKNGQAR